MALSDTLTIATAPNGWAFRNLFYDRAKGLFYCRLHEINTFKPVVQWTEVTAAGATMQIAFDNASKLAKES